MSAVYSSLLSALQQQLAGDTEAEKEIRRIANKVCGTDVFRDDELTNWQVSAIERLLLEWKGMFAFSPGRTDALPFLIDTLKVVRLRSNISDEELRGVKSWTQMQSLRGPGSNVLRIACTSCGYEYTSLYFGSFAEGAGTQDDYRVCQQCGHVVLRGASKDLFPKVCTCGGKLTTGCPNCGSNSGSTTSDKTPYEYFQAHTFSCLDGTS